MRTLKRNKRSVYYARYLGSEPVTVTDAAGNVHDTLEVKRTYSDPVLLECNVSAAAGAEDVDVFGSLSDYTRTICTSDTSLPIDEDTVLWFGIEPTEPYNYIVKRVADSKNGLLIAIAEVSVSNG